MRLMDVLPDYEAQRFNRPPVLSSDERKNCFKIDNVIREYIENTKKEQGKRILID